MWWEVLPAFGIIIGATWAAGQGVGAIQRWQNGGRPRRVKMDGFDVQLIRRDEELTGNTYTQKVPFQ